DLLRKMIAEDPDAVLTARADGRLVGYLVSNLDEGLVWLAWFGVVASHRRHGIGTALLEAFEVTIRPRGCHKIWCDCRSSNEKSIAALTKAGYTIIAEVKNH